MPQRTQSNPFPIHRSMIELTAASIAAAVVALLLWQTLGRHGYAGPVIVVCGWVWLCTVISMAATVRAGQSNTMHMVRVCMGSNLLRFAACVAVCILLVVKLEMPADTVLISLAIVYIPLVFLEAGRVGHYLWQKTPNENLG